MDLVGKESNDGHEFIGGDAGLGYSAFVVGIIEPDTIAGQLVGRENGNVFAAALSFIMATRAIFLIQDFALLPIVQVLFANRRAHFCRKIVLYLFAPCGT